MRWFGITYSVFFLLMIPSCKAGSGHLSYDLFIGTSAQSFESSDSAVAGGGSVGGRVFLRINGNLIDSHATGGQKINLANWLKNGANVLKVSGSSKQSIYIKVTASTSNGAIVGIPLRLEIPPSASVDVSDKFKAAIPYRLRLYQSKLHDDKKTREAVRKYIGHLYGRISARDSRYLKDELLRGVCLWRKKVFGADQKAFRQVMARKIDGTYCNKSRTLVETRRNLDDVKIIVGENSVFVYSAFSPETDKKPYLFSFRQSGNIEYVSHVSLVLINGEWTIWD